MQGDRTVRPRLDEMTPVPASPFRRIHHVAVICRELEPARRFYTEVLGLAVVAENFQWHRGSTKLDLALPDGGRIELFHFTDAPPRPTRPEAAGLRHLALAVEDLDAVQRHLKAHGVEHEPTRVDEYTGRRFCFFADPDGLPIEAYEVG